MDEDTVMRRTGAEARAQEAVREASGPDPGVIFLLAAALVVLALLLGSALYLLLPAAF